MLVIQWSFLDTMVGVIMQGITKQLPEMSKVKLYYSTDQMPDYIST